MECVQKFVATVPNRGVLAKRGQRKRKNLNLKAKALCQKNNKQYSCSESSSSSTSSSSSSSEDESESEEQESGNGEEENETQESEEEESEEEDSEEEESDEESQESEDDYKKGGYHPVRIGEICDNGRYRILRKLGWGVYSTVWLTKDRSNGEFAALKVVKSGSFYTEVALDEIRLLNCIKNTDKNDVRQYQTVQLITHCGITGPHGTHICMAFEVCGPNLYSVLQKRYRKGFPLTMVKSIMKQIFEALDYLHDKCGIIHTDLKPENILTCINTSSIKIRAKEAEDVVAKSGDNLPPSFVINAPDEFPKIVTREEMENKPLSKNMKKKLKKKLKKQKEKENQMAELSCEEDSSKTNTEDEEDSSNEEDFKVKIGDFGLACWVHKQFTEHIQTRNYRSPEVILEHKYDTAVDIWSAACVAFEIATGKCLFDPRKHKGYSRSEEHLCLMIRMLGSIPKEFRLTGKKSKSYFNLKTGKLKHAIKYESRNLERTLIEKYDWDEDYAEEFSEFLLPMLEYEPSKRASAQECLKHPWLNPSDEEIKDDKANEDNAPVVDSDCQTEAPDFQSGDLCGENEIGEQKPQIECYNSKAKYTGAEGDNDKIKYAGDLDDRIKVSISNTGDSDAQTKVPKPDVQDHDGAKTEIKIKDHAESQAEFSHE